MITTLVAAVVSAGAFKCAIYDGPREATSKDNKVRATVLFDGTFTIHRQGSSMPRHTGKWSRFGHHYRVAMSPDGSAFAIIDPYGGMEVFNSRGGKIAFLDPRVVLSKKEAENTPGKWTCHGEGTWLVNPKIQFKKDRLEFTIYNGRKVTVDL